MTNKNNHRGSYLSTVSIAYTPAPLRLFPRLTHRQVPRQADSFAPQFEPPPEQVFNDSNLKLSHERLKPIKQSALVRPRINIYRRPKKQFYETSSHCLEEGLCRQGNQTALQQKQLEYPVQNKEAFKRRKLVSFGGDFSKCKTHSSEKNNSGQYIKREFKQNEQMAASQPPLRVSQQEEKRLGRTVQFGQGLVSIDKAIVTIPKAHHLSSLIQERKATKAQFEVRRLKSPAHTLKSKQVSRVRIDVDNEEERTAAYEAWENVDVFSSNKNGIVEYTRQAVEPAEGQIQGGRTRKRRTLIKE